MSKISRKGIYFTRHEYPQLGQKESEVWTRFLKLTDLSFTHIDYSVRVGKGAKILDKWSRKTANMVKAITRKRIDAIGYTPESIYIFETCEEGDVTPLGQLLTYEYHYKEEYSPVREVKKTLICEDVDLDVKPLLEKHEIKVYNITTMSKE